MPYARVSIAKELDAETADKLIERIGKAINNIPEKVPQFTMVELCDGAKMFLGGKRQEDVCYIDIKYFGKFPFEQRKAVAEDAAKAIKELFDIPVEKVYLTMNEYETWGALGGFRDIFYTG